MLAVTLVLARVLAEANTPAPTLSDEAILVLKRHDIRVGNGCSGSDAGVGDGGDGPTDGPGDAASDGPVDGGIDDGGIDGGIDDGGIDGGDAGFDADPCEHIPGDAITLVMQPRFSQLTTGARFALIMVTPSRPVVETTSYGVFDALDEATQPIIKEVIKKVEDPAVGRVCRRYDGAGCGGGWDSDEPDGWTPPAFGDGGLGDFDGGYSLDDVGPYQVLRANPTTTTELSTWLTSLNYLVMPDDIAAVAPYIAKGYTVVALRVALDDTSDGQLAPIAVTWAGSEIRLPASLGTPGAFPMTVYIAADERYDMPGAHVPFAYPIGWSAETSFVTRNEYTFDPTVHEDPVAIQVTNSPYRRETREVIVERRVPVVDESECGCGQTSGGDGCAYCATGNSPRPDWAIVLGTIVFTMVPRRRCRRRRR